MKKIAKIVGLCAGLCLFAASCSNDDAGTVAPGDISNLTAEARAGKIVLHWNVPADSNYFYVKATYNVPGANETYTRIASVYADTMVVDGLYQKYGEINFNVQPFSSTNTGGNMHTISKTCMRVPASYSIASGKPIPLVASQLSTNAQEPNEGPIANLVDGNKNTYFHTKWSGGGMNFPHWIDVELENPLQAFTFTYWTRADNANGTPSNMDVMVSNDKTNWVTVTTITSGLPTTKAAEYNAGKYFILAPNSYKYIRFNVTKAVGTSQYFGMAELYLTEGIVSVYDPETMP